MLAPARVGEFRSDCQADGVNQVVKTYDGGFKQISERKIRLVVFQIDKQHQGFLLSLRGNPIAMDSGSP
jgi:hypothetical protein